MTTALDKLDFFDRMLYKFIYKITVCDVYLNKCICGSDKNNKDRYISPKNNQ